MTSREAERNRLLNDRLTTGKRRFMSPEIRKSQDEDN